MTEERHPDVVVLTRARTPFEAQVIAGVLRGAGIPAYAGSHELQDEFAVSQALSNQLYVEVQVPADRIEDARRALLEAEEGKKILEREDFDPSPPLED